MPQLFQKRESVAQLATLLLAFGATYMSVNLRLRHEPAVIDKPIHLALVELPAEENPPPPPPPKTTIRPLRPSPTPPRPQPAPPVLASPVENTALPAPVALPITPLSPVATALPSHPVITANPAAEGRFTQDVRARIEKRKEFPATAMALGMSGKVEVAYVLDRRGAVLSAKVSSSSGYPLLDQAALRAVRSASYLPMSDDMWPEEKQKEFHTNVVFSID